jgi:hypothetical protein
LRLPFVARSEEERKSMSSRRHQTWAEAMAELQSGFASLTNALGSVTAEMKIHGRVQAWMQGREADYRLHAAQLSDWLRHG